MLQRTLHTQHVAEAIPRAQTHRVSTRDISFLADQRRVKGFYDGTRPLRVAHGELQAESWREFRATLGRRNLSNVRQLPVVPPLPLPPATPLEARWGATNSSCSSVAHLLFPDDARGFDRSLDAGASLPPGSRGLGAPPLGAPVPRWLATSPTAEPLSSVPRTAASPPRGPHPPDALTPRWLSGSPSKEQNEARGGADQGADPAAATLRVQGAEATMPSDHPNGVPRVHYLPKPALPAGLEAPWEMPTRRDGVELLERARPPTALLLQPDLLPAPATCNLLHATCNLQPDSTTALLLQPDPVACAPGT